MSFAVKVPNFRIFLFAAAILFVSQPLSSAEIRFRTVFADQIIRSLSAGPENVLVGMKGRAPGTAKVFESRDRGRSWG